MIKKHQNRSVYASNKKSFLKQLLKKTFKPTKENPNIEKKHVSVVHKLGVLGYFDPWDTF